MYVCVPLVHVTFSTLPVAPLRVCRDVTAEDVPPFHRKSSCPSAFSPTRPPVMLMSLISRSWRPLLDEISIAILLAPAAISNPSIVTSTFSNSIAVPPVITMSLMTRSPPSCAYARLNPPTVVPLNDTSSLPSSMEIP